MKKFKQDGFSPIETILIVIIVGLVAFIALYVYNTKNNTDNIYKVASSTPTLPISGTTKNSSGQIITTKTDTKLGKYLAGSNGKALYTYDSDTKGKSNCSGSCLTTWPIYSAASAPSSLPTNVTVITRGGGGKQYGYKDMPLYYFTSDDVGKVTGDGVGGFSLAKP